MDVFEKVQETRPEIEGVDENLAAARALLMAEIQGERKPARPRAARRSWFIAAGLVGAAAAVTAGVLVANSLTAPEPKVEAVPTRAPGSPIAPSPEPTPMPLTASVVLTGASQAAASTVVPGPGQFLRVDTVQQQLISYNSVDAVNDLAVNRMNAESAWTLVTASSEYIPADVADVWTIDYVTGRSIGAHFGVDAQARSEQFLSSLADPGDSPPLRLPGGPDAWWVGYWKSGGQDSRYATLLASIPADPASFIAWLQAQGVEPEKMGWVVARMLSENAGTPAQRSMMYAALSQLPGAELIQSDALTATVMYETEGGDPAVPLLVWYRTVTIDRATGYVTEYTERLGSNPALVPDSLPDLKRTYSFDIVDSAP